MRDSDSVLTSNRENFKQLGFHLGGGGRGVGEASVHLSPPPQDIEYYEVHLHVLRLDLKLLGSTERAGEGIFPLPYSHAISCELPPR